MLDDLARALPDVPRWVETRAMLLRGDCEVLGLATANGPAPGPEGAAAFVVRDTLLPLVAVVGEPDPAAVREAAAAAGGEAVVLAPPETRRHLAAALPGWGVNAAVLHLLPGALPADGGAGGAARLLEPAEVAALAGLPPGLHSELRLGARLGPVAAALDDGVPVAFCYAGSETEGLWDVSIDTLEPFRRRGHAARAFALLAARLGARGKRPVWGAEDWNEPSLRLAARLGFRPVDEVLLWRPPGVAPS
jgi:GNAT acetyltransferase-like protein